jgi:hypothetical protein
MKPEDSDTFSAPHERELLVRALTDTPPSGPAPAAEAALSPASARRLQELRAVQRQLDLAHEAERHAAHLEPTALDAKVSEMARRQLVGRRSEAPRPRAWRAWLLVAACLVAAPTVWLLRDSPPPVDVRLRGESTLQVEPEFASVAWKGDAGKLWHQVRVFDAEGRELERSTLLKANEWRPARAAQYPDVVTVRLWIVNSLQEGQERAAASVARSGETR